MTSDEIRQKVEQFHRDGFLVLPDAVSRAEAERLRAGLEVIFARPSEAANPYGQTLSQMWRPRLFEHGSEFEALIDNPRVMDIVEQILGGDCHLIAMSALKTGPGESVAGHFHADETVRFPRPPDVPLDPRIQAPCFIINLNYYLCDVDEEIGPTQLVPGSHRSGRQPEKSDMDGDGLPRYEGHDVVNAVGAAGTVVMWHDQTWHRGAPNRSRDRTRWVQQAPYGRRFIAQRFAPSMITYQMPPEILARANPRRKRLLGVHPPGAYG